MEEWLKTTDDPYDQARNRAVISEMQGDHKSTIEHISRYLGDDDGPDLSIGHGWLYLRRANAYRKLGRTDEAIADLEKACKIQNPTSTYCIKVAETYRHLGLLDQEMALLNRAEERDSNDKYIYLKRSRAYAARGLREKALIDAGRAIELSPQDIFCYISRSKIHSAQSSYQAALADVNRAVELSVGSRWPYRNRSEIYIEMRQYDKAVADLERCVAVLERRAAEYPEQSGWTKEVVSECLFAENRLREIGRIEDAENMFRKAMAVSEKLPADSRAQILLTRVMEMHSRAMKLYFSQKKPTEALVLYDEAVNTARESLNNLPHSVAAEDQSNLRNLLAQALAWRAHLVRVEESDVDQAIADCTEAIGHDPQCAVAYRHRAVAYCVKGEPEKAMADFDEAVRLDPKDKFNLTDRADECLKRREFEKAAADYDRVAELGTMSWWHYKRRAVAHFELGHYDTALESLAKAVELQPDDLSTLSWIPLDQAAQCPDESFRIGLLELADRSIELNEKAARAYAARGRLHAAFGQENKALSDLQAAFERLPADDTSGRLGLSETCYELGNLCGELAHRKETLPCLVKMTELQPKQPIVWYRCALAQLGASETDAYKTTCRGMVEALRDTASPAENYWTVWTCLLAADSVEDYSPLVEMAEQAVAAEPESDQYIKTLGGILYRAGRFEDAVQRLTKADQLIEDPDAKSMSSPAYTWYFLAMAHHKLGHDAEAKQWLDKANTWTEKVLAEHEAGTNSLPWNRRLTLELLQSEATGLIGGSGDDPKDATQLEQQEEQQPKG